jgi:hypothetical protein
MRSQSWRLMYRRYTKGKTIRRAVTIMEGRGMSQEAFRSHAPRN